MYVLSNFINYIMLSNKKYIKIVAQDFDVFNIVCCKVNVPVKIRKMYLFYNKIKICEFIIPTTNTRIFMQIL